MQENIPIKEIVPDTPDIKIPERKNHYKSGTVRTKIKFQKMKNSSGFPTSWRNIQSYHRVLGFYTHV